MRRHRNRPVIALLGAFIALSAPMVGAVPAAAAQNVVPMPGERFLTRAERQYVLDSMRPGERQQVGDWFKDGPKGLVVSYVRREFAVVTSSDGTMEAVEIAPSLDDERSAISVPLNAVAVSGGRHRTDLYMSLIVVRTRVSPPYEWELQLYSDWLAGTDGMDDLNWSEDSMAAAWHGGMSRYSDYASGRYKACGGVESALDIYKSDATPNAGVGYSFDEWTTSSCGDRPMKYGFGSVRIRENSWHNALADIVMKYYHTKTGLSYSLSLSAAPSISISPTKQQWSAVVQTSITH